MVDEYGDVVLGLVLGGDKQIRGRREAAEGRGLKALLLSAHPEVLIGIIF
jgi:hypothetical protein